MEAVECNTWHAFSPSSFVWLMRLCFNFIALLKENLLLSKFASWRKRGWDAEPGCEGCRRRVGLNRDPAGLVPLQGLMDPLRPIKIIIHRLWTGGQNMHESELPTQGRKAGRGGVVKRCLRP